MKRILFVDDEPNVLEGLERMLFALRKEWQMAFSRSGVEALCQMEQKAFDIIVSDMRMPGMDGATLLAEVMKQYPQTIRFILTGQSDRDTVFRSLGVAHQCLAKPCSSQMLKSCVDRAFGLRALLNDDALRQMISRIDTLPALPEAYARLVKELESPDTSASVVGKIIESDVAMTAKVLQLVNSAFFGLRQHVSSAAQAVTFLGLDTIKSLALMAGVFAQAKTTELPGLFSLDALWRHSLLVGSHARVVSQHAGTGETVVKDAFTAGLLHDVGVLVLKEHATDTYKEVLETARAARLPLAEAEQAAFACTHAEVGAYLLGIWGLPDSIVEAVAFHHSPSRCVAPGFTPLTAVHVVNVFAHEARDVRMGRAEQLDAQYIQGLGLHDRIEAWRELCLAQRDEAGHGPEEKTR